MNNMSNIEKEMKLVIEEYISSLNILEPEFKLKNIKAFKEKAYKAFENLNPEMHVVFGNAKLPETTAIVSCGTWFNCSGRTEGFCPLAEKCYDKCREVMSHKITKFRLEEEIAFRALNAFEIAQQIISQIKIHNNKPKFKNKQVNLIRWNEVGELRNQEDLNKMIEASNIIFDELNIKSYVYTHNKYLNFNIPRPNLIINGSNFMVDNEYKVVRNIEEEFNNLQDLTNKRECICDCTQCSYCSHNNGFILIEEER